ncbi:MAG: nucleoside-diphosphate kinase [Treponema sp.]|jgi:nucleoside diphosphate kinase|nr:nucleoside-diphosphate kinase [Treponema sp.]
MKQTISYVMVTPYTIAKSRTGGVMSRLLARVDLELVGAQMIAPDEAFAREYAMYLRRQNAPNDITLLSDYVEQNLAPSQGRRHRTLLLLFRGENPCGKLVDICGHLYSEHRLTDIDALKGESIRDTYADLISSPDNPAKPTYFEPAVITPRNQKDADEDLALFSRFLEGQENIIRNIRYPDPSQIEQTLVIIKPDNWSHPSSKPGTIIDMFSRTGLRIVGLKVHRFSLAEALEFYGPVEGALQEKLAPVYGKKARDILEREFGFTLSGEAEKALTASVGLEYARDQFRRIIKYMSGIKPEECAADCSKAGNVMCLILFYEGENAIRKIRDVLGPTDPLKAPSGTVRREFGSNVMENTAHASDSPESVKREQMIVRINENHLRDIINEYLIQNQQ